MSNRKYPKVQGYWLYSIYVPSVAKYYIGVSKQQCCQRWQKANYKNSSLEPYLNEWDSMIKTVLIDGLTKEEALKIEDELIVEYKEQGGCINEQRSGLIRVSDRNSYMREYRENNPEYQEYQKQCNKQYREDNKEKINQQKKQRYENDIEYREQQKQRSKQWYENNREKKREYDKQRYLKKKLEKQPNQLTLFNEAS